MKLIVENGALSPGSVFKLVAIGWFVGVGALFVLVLIPMLIVGSIALVSDNAPTVQWPDLLTIIMIPIVLAGQAIMFGAIGALGYVALDAIGPSI